MLGNSLPLIDVTKTKEISIVFLFFSSIYLENQLCLTKTVHATISSLH